MFGCVLCLVDDQTIVLCTPTHSEMTGRVARTFNIYAGRIDLLGCDLSTAGGEQRSRGCKNMILVSLQGHTDDPARLQGGEVNAVISSVACRSGQGASVCRADAAMIVHF